MGSAGQKLVLLLSVVNLTANAVKFTEQGEVCVQVRDLEREGACQPVAL